MENKTSIRVETRINTPRKTVWALWTSPEHIVRWNAASDDWHTTKAENDLTMGGKFLSRMEAKDGSMGFDFRGRYDRITPYELIEYTLEDGRKVKVEFNEDAAGTQVIETFEAEEVNSKEMQRSGWQSILNNFKNYAESQ